MGLDLMTGVSVGVSVIGTGVSAAFAFRATKMAKLAQVHASRQAAAEWLRDLRKWADQAIEVLSTAIYQSVPDREHTEAIEARLSALIDRGRFFLPNQRTSEYGTDKEYAYRGYRHSALDALAAAECVLRGEGTGRFPTAREALIAMKRAFVSSVQQIIAPERQTVQIASMILEADAHRADDPSLGGLLPSNAIPGGVDQLLGRT